MSYKSTVQWRCVDGEPKYIAPYIQEPNTKALPPQRTPLYVSHGIRGRTWQIPTSLLVTAHSTGLFFFLLQYFSLRSYLPSTYLIHSPPSSHSATLKLISFSCPSPSSLRFGPSSTSLQPEKQVVGELCHASLAGKILMSWVTIGCHFFTNRKSQPVQNLQLVILWSRTLR